MATWLQTLLAFVSLLSLAACDVAPAQNTSPPVSDQISFIVRTATTAAGDLTIDLGVANRGELVPADDAFNGVWQLTREGQPRASGVVHQLQQLPAGETIVLGWQSEIQPGRYALIWGAPGYGHTEVTFEVIANETGGLRLGQTTIFETTADPPEDLTPALDSNGATP